MHLAALSNDPLGDLNPSLTYDINLDATRSRRPRARRRRAWGASSSRRRARCTARPEATTLLDENAPLRPLTPYAESKVRAEEALAELDDGDFVAVSMRNATVYGVSPRLRLDIVLNNLAAWAHTTGPDPAPQRRDVVAAAPPRAGPREGRRSRCSRRRATLVRGEAFNVGSADAELPRPRPRRASSRTVTGCEVEFAGDASPDPRSLPRRLLEARARVSRPGASTGTRGAARRSSSTPTGRSASDRGAFEGRPYVRLRQLRHLLDERAPRRAISRWASASA